MAGTDDTAGGPIMPPAPAGKPPAKGAKGRGPGHDAEVRREAIVQLMLQAIPEWKIAKAVVRDFKVSERTVRRDFQIIGERARALHDDPNFAERRVSTVVERLDEIARTAQDRGKFHAAISANVQLVRLLGLRSVRWGPKAAIPGGAHVEVNVNGAGAGDSAKIEARVLDRVRELVDLDDEALDAEERKVARRLRLVVGGLAEGADSPEGEEEE